jgi:hypothetical protein
MNSILSLAVSLAGLLPMQSGGMDMAVAEKWGKAKVVRYRVEGVHNGREAVVHGDYEGKADVIDRVTVEFTWDCKKRKVVGEVTVTDGKTELKNIKSDGTNCPPPQLKGEYEHFQTVSHSVINGEQIRIKGTRTYPPAMVSNYPGSCSMRSIPGAREEAFLFAGVADPAALGMPTSPGGPIAVAADRKSFSVKGAENWVWIFTPTLVQ